jgi:hypothetical protein
MVFGVFLLYFYLFSLAFLSSNVNAIVYYHIFSVAHMENKSFFIKDKAKMVLFSSQEL